MDKQALINYTKTVVSSTDGVYFLLEPERFLKLLLMEDCVSLNLFRPQESAKITNLKWWKERLVIMAENRYKLHNDLLIVLRKDPDRNGELDGFIFDGFLFKNITQVEANRIRSLLNETGKGLYKNNQELTLKKSAVIIPYYVRLVDIQDTREDQGILILRNFY